MDGLSRDEGRVARSEEDVGRSELRRLSDPSNGSRGVVPLGLQEAKPKREEEKGVSERTRRDGGRDATSPKNRREEEFTIVSESMAAGWSGVQTGPGQTAF